MPTPKAPKRPTWTHLVEEALRTADDFVSMKALCEQTGGSPNQVSAALYSLQSYRVVDCVASPDGLHWFFRGEDSRCRSLEERTPEDKSRKPRRNLRVGPKAILKGQS
jgi:hypothetical protein